MNNSFKIDSRMLIFGHSVVVDLLCPLVSKSIRSDNVLILKLPSQWCLPSPARPPFVESDRHGAEQLEEKDEVCK